MTGTQAYERPACGPCNLGDHQACCWPEVPCKCHDRHEVRDKLDRLADELPEHPLYDVL